MDTKQCTKCKETKSVSEFSRDRYSPSGLTSWCKACLSDYHQANKKKRNEQSRAYNQANKEKLAKSSKIYRLAHKDQIKIQADKWVANNLDKARAKSRRWRRKNRDKEVARCKRWREEHLDEERERNRQWAKMNQEKIKAKSVNRRARKNGAPGFAVVEQIEARWEMYGNRCYICGKPAEATDHVIPLAGGVVLIGPRTCGLFAGGAIRSRACSGLMILRWLDCRHWG